MKTLIDCVIKPMAAFLLAAVVANCNDGCIPGWQQMSPADAYAAEVSGCVMKRNAEVMKCAQEAGTVPEYQECHEDAEEAHRICREAVDRKYLGYNIQGGYPGESNPPPAR